MNKTVSLEMAKRLKKAGLKWEPKVFDMANNSINKETSVLTECDALGFEDEYGGITYKEWLKRDCLWLPTTDDLLDWLEKEGYLIDLKSNNPNEWPDKYSCDLISQGKKMEFLEVRKWADTRPDAAGEAVCWVLGQKGGK